jgi:hypothetical protein
MIQRCLAAAVALLLLGIGATPLSAFALRPIVDACAKAYSVDQLADDLQADGWSPLTQETFDTFAQMMADNYLNVDQRGLAISAIGRTWPEMVAKVRLDRFWYLEPQQTTRILQKFDGDHAFIYLIHDEKVRCIMFLSSESFDQTEVESLVGSSKKWLTPTGFKQTKVVRKLKDIVLYYQIIASQSTGNELKNAGSESANTNLVLTVAPFTETPNP